MNMLTADWSTPQRQGGSALFIIFFKTVIDLFKNTWPVAVAILFTGKGNRGDKIEWFLLAFSVLVLIISFVAYFFFSFQIINNELVIRKGFLTKKIITLPLHRIIAVHIEQTWLHRLFNAAEVSFDAAGTEKTEVEIKAIPLRKAESLREFITRQNPETTLPENTPITKTDIFPVISLSENDLLKLCLSANHIEALFILLAFAISIVDNISQASGWKTSGILSWLYEHIDTHTVAGIIKLLLIVLLVSIAISCIRVLLRYSDFRVVRSEKGFSIRHGLVNTKEKLVPFCKIQYLSWKANWLREKIGIFMLQFHVAGSGTISQRMEVKAPAPQIKFVDEILKDYHVQLSVHELVPVRTEREYIVRRILLNGVFGAVIFFFIGLLLIKEYAFLFFFLVPYAAFTGWLFQRKFRLWMVPEALQVKKGIFGTEKSILLWSKIQSVHFRQSLYQQKRKLATLKLFTAGGIIIIPFIKKEIAIKIYNYALYKIECGSKPWM